MSWTAAQGLRDGQWGSPDSRGAGRAVAKDAGAAVAGEPDPLPVRRAWQSAQRPETNLAVSSPTAQQVRAIAEQLLGEDCVHLLSVGDVVNGRKEAEDG